METMVAEPRTITIEQGKYEALVTTAVRYEIIMQKLLDNARLNSYNGKLVLQDDDEIYSLLEIFHKDAYFDTLEKLKMKEEEDKRKLDEALERIAQEQEV